MWKWFQAIILLLCPIIIVFVWCGLLFFNIQNDFYNYIIIVFIYGVNGHLVFVHCNCMENNNQLNWQNIFVCVQQKKNGDTSLEQHECEYIFIFKSKQMNEWMNMDQCSALIHLHSTPAPSLQYYDHKRVWWRQRGIMYLRCVWCCVICGILIAIKPKERPSQTRVQAPTCLCPCVCDICFLTPCTGTPPTQAKLRRQS